MPRETLYDRSVAPSRTSAAPAAKTAPPDRTAVFPAFSTPNRPRETVAEPPLRARNPPKSAKLRSASTRTRVTSEATAAIPPPRAAASLPSKRVAAASACDRSSSSPPPEPEAAPMLRIRASRSRTPPGPLTASAPPPAGPLFCSNRESLTDSGSAPE